MDDTKKKFNLNSQTKLDDLKGRLAYTHDNVLGIITYIKTISPPPITQDNYMYNYTTTYEATIINKDCNSNTVDLSKVTDISDGKYTYEKEPKEGTYDDYYDICSPQIVLESDAGGKRTRNKRRRQTRRKSKKGKSRRKQQRR